MPLALKRTARYTPRAPRKAVRVPTSLRHAGGECAIVLLDLSRDGFLASIEETLAPGEVVVVSLPGIGPVEAEVRWAEEGKCGAQFGHSLPAHWLAHF